MTPAITSCVISAADVVLLRDHARRAAPAEACGLLLGRPGQVLAVEATRNVAAHPERSFEIDPAALLRVHREARGAGHRIVGWYHSHPDGNGAPSPTDAARAVEDGMLWLIVAGDAVSAWRTAAGGAQHLRFDAVALDIA